MKKIIDIVTEIAKEPFTEDRIIQTMTLLAKVRKKANTRWEAKIVNGNYYRKLSDGTFYSINSLSALRDKIV